MNKIKLLIIAGSICCITSCYYDNEDDLRPNVTVPAVKDTTTNANTCDTTVTISYLGNIVPILNLNCGSANASCHSTGNMASGVALDNYADVNSSAMDGSLLGTILHQSGSNPMPKGGGMLDNCSINKIKSWINHGALNN